MNRPPTDIFLEAAEEMHSGNECFACNAIGRGDFDTNMNPYVWFFQIIFDIRLLKNTTACDVKFMSETFEGRPFMERNDVSYAPYSSFVKARVQALLLAHILWHDPEFSIADYERP